jgi:hypothetical protein
MLKSTGYLISTLSVILLGVVSWKAASQDHFLLLCLILGMLASGAGMLLRWLAFQNEQRARRRHAAPVLHIVGEGHIRRSR